MSAVFELCDRWIARYAELDPYAATTWGFRELEDKLPDYSPEGVAARAEHRRAGLAGLAGTTIESDHDRLAADVMRDILEVEEALDEADEWLRPLYVFGSPVQHLRQAFDLMVLEGEDDWRRAAARMNELPKAVDQLISTLEEGIRRRVMAAPRQALACAEMAANWAGLRPRSSVRSTLTP